eukprot:SAG31_NODE_27969_length_417_cov_1.018868_1_plen_20_part_10
MMCARARRARARGAPAIRMA